MRGPQFDNAARSALAGKRGARESVAAIVEHLANLQCSAELCVLVKKG